MADLTVHSQFGLTVVELSYELPNMGVAVQILQQSGISSLEAEFEVAVEPVEPLAAPLLDVLDDAVAGVVRFEFAL